ncbi:FAD-dependent oxidoreductase [Defluviimonas sp. D31]|uniref:protoporphyrinogen/coproporphyrinogen oxidase n=1 Tax=Defluviimonas sp. D31 TaxID=3083253 RepID=UPI00296FCDF8|nr:FAD-dependent oxidoreductase [Defluviimonas sp. D31]MDW4549863.1 FAD-dependent oxidoreductase [Defluviimonas sp. D31]
MKGDLTEANVAEQPRITVLGAGPAGIAAAYALSRDGAEVEVLERAPVAGGNSASFQIDGIWCDYGSHRFHPVADPKVLADVKRLLGDDLLLQPRHGRIRLGGRWIHFPLKPTDALLRLPPAFAASLLGDMALKPFRRKRGGKRSFSSVLYDGLGPTISENFYFPYVRKLWGLDPDKLAVTLAERRVSSGSVGKILAKMAKMVPGLRGETTGRFYYPREGFGQISRAMAAAAEAEGALFRFGADIVRIERTTSRVTGVVTRAEGEETRHEADQVFSTIPLTIAVRLMDPPPPPEVMMAAEAIRFRGMILVYLILETDRFTEYDAHYFPELSIPISRMSEPKNYNSATGPKGRTILCAELPCDPGERWWGMSDEELGRHYCDWLKGVGLPVKVPVIRCETRRIAHAYPVYDLDYQRHFETVDGWLSSLDGFLSFGRQGLFAHDNTHHAFAMAYAAAESLTAAGGLDRDRWAGHRHEFESHRVED